MHIATLTAMGFNLRFLGRFHYTVLSTLFQQQKYCRFFHPFVQGTLWYLLFFYLLHFISTSLKSGRNKLTNKEAKSQKYPLKPLVTTNNGFLADRSDSNQQNVQSPAPTQRRCKVWVTSMILSFLHQLHLIDPAFLGHACYHAYLSH